MDRPSFWIAWGIIALVLTFIIGSIIDSYDIAFYISAGIIVLIWIIWFCVDKVKEQSDIDQMMSRILKGFAFIAKRA